jgi:hypothetical protein
LSWTFNNPFVFALLHFGFCPSGARISFENNLAMNVICRGKVYYPPMQG